MKKAVYTLVLAAVFLQSCKDPQPKILEYNSKFDLEKINFEEDIPLLFSKHIMIDETEHDSITHGKLSDSMLVYRIGNSYSRSVLKIPQEDFGFRYDSPTMDSIARFHDIYFKKLSVLTDNSKKPVAFYAEREFRDAQIKGLLINNFIELYGQPKYSFSFGGNFNKCSYEWDLQDRTIQVETSMGFIIFSSKKDTSDNGEYLNFRMLIVDNNSKVSLNNAHIYDFSKKPEIKINGELYHYSALGFKEKTIYEDDFFLNSSDEKYIKDQDGRYNIRNAEAYIYK